MSKNDLIILLATLAYLFVTIYIPLYLKLKNKVSSFTARKIIHIFSGLTIFFIPLYDNVLIPLLVSLVTTFGAFCASDKTKVKLLRLIYKEIHEKDEEIVGYLQGPFAYAIAITLLSLLAYLIPNGMYFAIVPVLLMIFSDTFASFIGKKYGKIKLTFARNNRSLEGFLAFAVSGIVVCYIGYTYVFEVINITDTHLSTQIVKLSIVTSLIGGIIELFSPSHWDDLVIPVGTALLLFAFI